MRNGLFFISLFLSSNVLHVVVADAQNSPSQNTALNTPLKPLSTVLNLVNVPINIAQDLKADKFFQEALTAFSTKDNMNAAIKIRTGALEILKEAPKDENNLKYALVEQRVGELFTLALRVEAGMILDKESLQTKFADAEESVAHRYYESTNTLIAGTADDFADRLLGLSVHLRNSKEYHIPQEKALINDIANEAADLSVDIRKMKTGDRELSPALKTRLNKLMAEVKALKLSE